MVVMREENCKEDTGPANGELVSQGKVEQAVEKLHRRGHDAERN